jgi:hypothetical protein
MVLMSESCSENWGKYADMTFPTRCYVDGHIDEVLYIKMKHIIADNYVICFNHTASYIGFVLRVMEIRCKPLFTVDRYCSQR